MQVRCSLYTNHSGLRQGVGSHSDRVVTAAVEVHRPLNDDGLVRAGDAIEAGIKTLLTRGEPLTYDLVGEERAAPMSVVTTAIIEAFDAALA